MNHEEYAKHTAGSLAKLIKEGDVTPFEVLDAAHERVRAFNPSVNAIVTTCFDVAEKHIKHLKGDEPFYGVPLVVKDLSFAIKGVRQTEGSRLFKDNIANINSDFVERAMSLGFVPFAKSNAPELGLSYVTEPELFGACKNPYDLKRTPGGSSGGSAVAVATGMAPVATASDGGGSIRIPAACCGLIGLKPTNGSMPSGPYGGEIWSGMGENFILAKSIEDTISIYPQLTDRPYEQVEKMSHSRPLKFLTINGIFADVEVDVPNQNAFQDTTKLLNQLGHEVHEKTLNLDLDKIGECTLSLIAANTFYYVSHQEQSLGRQASSDDVEPVTRYFYDIGKSLSASELIHAKNVMYYELRALHQMIQQVDFLITPALAKLPIEIGSLNMDEGFEKYVENNMAFSPFTSLFNQAGMPAMTIPVSQEPPFPLSVQFVAGKGQDLKLLQLAALLKPHLPDITITEPQTDKG